SRQGFIASGLHYKISLSKQSSVSSTLSWNTNDIQHVSQRLNNSMQLLDHQQIKSLQGRITSYTVLEKKWHPTFVQRSGIYFHRVYANHVLRTFESNSWQTIANSNKTAQHLQVYTQSKWSISNQVQVLAGVYSSYLSLSKQMTLEPRISGSWLLHDKHTLSAAYGNHSQMERLALYSIQNPNGQLVNSKLKLSRAHHYLIAYEWIPSEKIRMKAEPYWQHLYQLPVVDSSSFSAVNMTGDWFFQQKLINTGQGENIGLDVTVERFLDKGFYYLLTGSVFRSRYQGGDGIWRDTRFNRQWILNALGGWEWKMGKSKSHLGSINLRLTMQGGERITPAHWENNQLVNDESKAFQQSLPAQTLLHTTLQYRINRKKHASLWSLQVINALATPDIQGYVYNRFTHQLDYNQNVLFIPNLSYKIEW
nr:hypothetical protein [Cytophagaceae bacterium]